MKSPGQLNGRIIERQGLKLARRQESSFPLCRWSHGSQIGPRAHSSSRGKTGPKRRDTGAGMGNSQGNKARLQSTEYLETA